MNIVSVKQLDLVPGNFVAPQSFPGGGYGLAVFAPTSPEGFVFGYNSDAQQFETFRNWASSVRDVAFLERPNVIACLDQGIVSYQRPDGHLIPRPEPQSTIAGFTFDLLDAAGNLVTVDQEGESFSYEGGVYPVTTVVGKRIAVDQSKVLLTFLLLMHEVLSKKLINPNINFLDSYLQDTVLKAALRVLR